MGKVNTGGMAFPVHESGKLIDDGMTLRDWFAGQALGPIVRQALKETAKQESIAELAYSIADAMLAEQNIVR